ncbi:MAG: HlyD family secretion protein [Rhodobacteraceae bacterium]|nr:HlyD family secretion protein [Paracoccaceae bacterium]
MVRFLQGLVLAAVALFAWYVVADRATPFTSNARVKAVITPVVPQVSGQVVEIAIANGQEVQPGDLLARIDPRLFQIAQERAQAELEQATQSVGVGSADVQQAQAQLVRAETDLSNMQLQSGRIFELERKGLIAVARADDARAALSDAEAGVQSARAALSAAEARLGADGADNAAVRVALAKLAEAEVNLSKTDLEAPAQGVVSNLTVAEGIYAKAGSPLMSFIDSENVWIEAYMTENNLGRMAVGTPVDVVLDIHPGRVLRGEVESFSGAVSLGGLGGSGGLAAPPPDGGWMRAAQRFPVRIILPGYTSGSSDDDVVFQANGQADVIAYTGEAPVINALGRAYIRLVALLSYVY